MYVFEVEHYDIKSHQPAEHTFQYWFRTLAPVAENQFVWKMIVWQSNTKEIPFDVYLFNSRVLRALLPSLHILLFFFIHISSTASYRDWCLATTLYQGEWKLLIGISFGRFYFILSIIIFFLFSISSEIDDDNKTEWYTCNTSATCTAPQVHHSIEWILFIFLSVIRTHHLFSNEYSTLLHSPHDAQHSLRISIWLKEFGVFFLPSHKRYAIIFFFFFIMNIFILFWSSQMMSA